MDSRTRYVIKQSYENSFDLFAEKRMPKTPKSKRLRKNALRMLTKMGDGVFAHGRLVNKYWVWSKKYTRETIRSWVRYNICKKEPHHLKLARRKRARKDLKRHGFMGG